LTETTPVVCLVLNVERNKVGAIALDSYVNLKPGLYGICSGRLMSVPTGILYWVELLIHWEIQ